VTDLWPVARDDAESWIRLPFGPFTSQAEFQGCVRFMATSTDEIVWTVRPHTVDGVTSTAAGWLALLDIRPAHAAVELGNIWFPRGLARTRAATEAFFLILGYAFDRLGYQRVAWKCDPANLASRRAAERLGFRLEGILRSHLLFKRCRRDTAYFSLLAEEWPARREALSEWLQPGNFDPAGMAIARLRRPVNATYQQSAA
jgi:RimJ/RimL family protein N-acetyltransferase